MHQIFKLYEISPGPGFLAIEDEGDVPGDLCLKAVGLFRLREAIRSAIKKPDTYEFQLPDRDVWIDVDSDCLHGIPPFPQILSDF